MQDEDGMNESAVIEGRCSGCGILYPIRVLEKHGKLCRKRGRKPARYVYDTFNSQLIIE